MKSLQLSDVLLITMNAIIDVNESNTAWQTEKLFSLPLMTRWHELDITMWKRHQGSTRQT